MSQRCDGGRLTTLPAAERTPAIDTRRAGHHAVRDVMPCRIPCCMGYHAVWDTMLGGWPAHRQCDATAVPRPDVRGWARTDGRRPSANRISYSVASRTCEWRALNEGATDSSLGVSVRACVRACVCVCVCVCVFAVWLCGRGGAGRGLQSELGSNSFPAALAPLTQLGSAAALST